MSNTNFEIGQIIAHDSRDYTSAAVWCNAGNGILTSLDNDSSRIDPIPTPTQEELNQQRILEIDTELASLDTKSARSLRSITAGVSTEQDQLAITALEARATELRAERAILSPPTTFSL